jgi:hypothetical protein
MVLTARIVVFKAEIDDSLCWLDRMHARSLPITRRVVQGPYELLIDQ